MAQSNEDAMYCYLISYRHPAGYASKEVRVDQPLGPFSTSKLVKMLMDDAGLESLVIINVFYQGCYSSEALENLKRLAEGEQAKPNLRIVKD